LILEWFWISVSICTVKYHTVVYYGRPTKNVSSINLHGQPSIIQKESNTS